MTALPLWIDPEAWADYMAMRKRIKKPMSDRRLRQLVARCYELHTAGHDVNQSLDEAADHEWLELYEPKDKTISHKTSSEADKTAQALKQREERGYTAPPASLKLVANKLRRTA